MNPLSCRHVCAALAREGHQLSSFFTRLIVRLHLMGCWICRRYAHQLRLISTAFCRSHAEQLKQSDTLSLKRKIIDQSRSA